MLNIEIISPKGIIFKSNCDMAVIPASNGDIGVMENHEAFIARLKIGKLSIFNNKEIIKEFDVLNGGVAEIHDGKNLVILLDS